MNGIVGSITVQAQDFRSATMYFMPAHSEKVAELTEALQTLLDAVEGNRVTVGDCNQARAALTKESA
jgi:hypothetical protein